MHAHADEVNDKNKQEMFMLKGHFLSAFSTSYLGLASLMVAGRGGLVIGAGGGSLVGNVPRLASAEGAIGTKCVL